MPIKHILRKLPTVTSTKGIPVHSVYRIFGRDGSSLGFILVFLPNINEARNLSKVCGLSGIRVEVPHRKESPSQCHRSQRFKHGVANCHANPGCVECLIPQLVHWGCPRTRGSERKPSCVNCDQNNTANYRGISPYTRTLTNPWGKKSAPEDCPRTTEGEHPPKAPALPPASTVTGPAISFRDDIKTVMSVLRTLKSWEISEYIQNLCICRNAENNLNVVIKYHHLMVKLVYLMSLPRCKVTPSVGCYKPHNISLMSFNANGLNNSHQTVALEQPRSPPLLRDAVILFGDFNFRKTPGFEIIALFMSTYYPGGPCNRSSTLDIVIIKGVAFNVSCIETIHNLDPDNPPVLVRMGSPAGESPNLSMKITNWNRVSTAHEKIDTTSLNSIPNDIYTTDEIDSTIDALTNQVNTVVGNNVREVVPHERISYCRV
ncbi:hypothetical protein EVAR_68674_1 [Eumeta japonica]|uniref:Endonuclease/exonuclease/phosphatase domain-containing protein n=1 Tax=Eumeta variegata TaxID=151549 RepID=A0A4C1SQU8_EUMVA|nr:hypothetical protein EVAR_68674_1 [Eumeta japonica]